MKKLFLTISLLILLFNFNFSYSQEWKNLRAYQKETKYTDLVDGCWLKKDRITNSFVWKNANKFNFNIEKGHLKYNSISQVRDFYIWFDKERVKQGHEIKWVGIAALALNQFSKFENKIIQLLIIRNDELIGFSKEGSNKVFEAAFPELSAIYYSQTKITGLEAEKWDKIQGENEQCVILEPLYNQLSNKTFSKLERMAKRKGIYGLGIPKKYKFEGDLKDCNTRVNYGISVLLPIYLLENEK